MNLHVIILPNKSISFLCYCLIMLRTCCPCTVLFTYYAPCNTAIYIYIYIYRPLSRRLDRCDRVIQNESRDPFGGNVYYVTMQRSTHYHQMGLSPHSRLQWRFRDKGLYCCVWTSCSVLPRVAKGHFCSRNYILGARVLMIRCTNCGQPILCLNVLPFT